MRVWVWVGMLWTPRVRLALENYGDRITDIAVFGWRVNAEGELTLTFDPALLQPYRERWPHLRFWLCFRNDGNPAIASALLSSSAAQDRLLADLEAVLEQYPWLHGIDIDLERIGGLSRAIPAENLFRRIASLAHRGGRECAAALPPLTATGSVGGENWARYRQLGEILDHLAIMSYDFAWSGSAPGPVSPGYWLRQVYDWATSQVPREKIKMGLPLYSYFWTIHDYPSGYRGGSGTYYAAWQHFTGYRAQDGSDADPGGSGSHHRIGWLAFRDPDSKSAWGFLDVYDWRYAPDWESGSNSGIIAAEWDGRPYTARYGRPSGTPLWSVADNSAPESGAAYALTPRRVRNREGELVGPKGGFTLTVESLKRGPVAATILDDNAATAAQLENLYDVASGSWARWSTGSYHQYRGSGELRLAHDFTGRATYLQVRGQFAATGWAGVTVRGVTAEVAPDGRLRVRRGSTVLATADVTARPVGSAAGAGRFVIGLRVRESTARVYFSTSEARELPLVTKVDVSPFGGAVGIVAEAALWVDHVYVGDGWWYQPREAVEVLIGSERRTLGRFPRSGITWDGSNRFRPDLDVDEWETRTGEVALDWVYDHWADAPLRADVAGQVRVRAIDHDVWVGRILAVDRDGAAIVYFSDAETIAHWRDVAELDYGLEGIALWTLGQEDMRTWERLAGGELPSATKVLNG